VSGTVLGWSGIKPSSVLAANSGKAFPKRRKTRTTTRTHKKSGKLPKTSNGKIKDGIRNCVFLASIQVNLPQRYLSSLLHVKCLAWHRLEGRESQKRVAVTRETCRDALGGIINERSDDRIWASTP
jgi:hypothetical protein